MNDYLALKVRTRGAVLIVMRDGERLMGIVEAESDDGLFLIDGWWIAPRHVLRARPAVV